MKKIMTLILSVSVVLMAGFQFSVAQVEAATVPSLSYQVNVENKGWLPITKNGEIAGTTGQGLGIKGIAIAIHNSPYQGGIEYITATSFGKWLNPSYSNATYTSQSNGHIAGNYQTNEVLEGIKVYLTGELANHYEIYVRAHISHFSWLDWGKGNESNYFGSGLGKKLEAVQLSLVKKGGVAPKVGPRNNVKLPMFLYKSHSENIGWSQFQALSNVPSTFSGTVGKSLKQEAMVVNFFGEDYAYPTITPGIRYRAYVQGSGWQDWVTQGKTAGTVGKNLRQEAFQLELTGGLEKHVDIYYRAHVAGTGWQPWVKNGAIAGTTGKNIRMEAYQIYSVYKNGPAPTSTY